MPRNGTTGVATQPINTRAVDGETIMADKWNSVTDDIYSILSAASPVTQGGTGASTASGARTALDVYAKSETYTKGEVDGFRTSDQNAAKNASNLTTGTVPDERLPDRLSYGPAWDGITLTDCNTAIYCGWYFLPHPADNKPASGHWVVLVSAASPDVMRQDAYSWDYRTHYYRTLDGTTWHGWERVFETAAEIQSIVTDSVKAWVRFYWNGTSVSVLASKNVSSVVRNAAGDYTVNFASALADGNYALSGAVSQFPSDLNLVPAFYTTSGSGYRPSTFASASSCRVVFQNRGGTWSDPYYEASLIFVR